MPEYQAIRASRSLLQICREPELAIEVTLQPVRRIAVDAAILFSDLLLPLEPMGLTFDFVKGEGPAFDNPVRSAADVERVRPIDPADAMAHVLETIRDRKSTRLNSSHVKISYAVFCLKKNKT